MPIDVIESADRFDALRPQWDAVYDRDLQGRVFLSWAWLRAHLNVTRRRPCIFAYRPPGDDAYRAFLPLAVEQFPSPVTPLGRDIYCLGNPSADYTGLIAEAQHEEAALAGFSEQLQAMRWDNFHAHDVSDERLTRMISTLPPDRFRELTLPQTKCPYIPLPSTWEEYLQTRLNKRFRGDLRRNIRAVKALPDFQIELLDAGNVEEVADLTLRFSQARYKNSPRYRYEQKALLIGCMRTNCLVGMVISTGKTPLATVLAFVDARRHELCAYKTAFNPLYASFSPGTVVAGLMIEHAIQSGFKVYDFSRGSERYKFHFGPELRFTHHTSVTRVGVRSSIGNAVRPLARIPVRITEKLLSRLPA